MIEDGYPTIFRTFSDNIRNHKYENKVIPMTIDSSQAYLVLKKSGIPIDIIYIDGAHDYYSVYNDLKRSYDLIKNIGHVCGDDYFGEIARAVDSFAYTRNFNVVSKENQYIIFDQFDSLINDFRKAGWQ